MGKSLLAALNTESECGFGGVIAPPSGFREVSDFLEHAVANPLPNIAETTQLLAGITGSAIGGMSIASASMGQKYVASARQATCYL